MAEALACGIPVVVSDKTPWRDVVKNNCGILAENKIDNFYDAFQSIRNIRYSKDICRNYVLANFDWKVVTGQFVKHFLK